MSLCLGQGDCTIDWAATGGMLGGLGALVTGVIAVLAFLVARSQLEHAKEIRDEANRPNVVMWLQSSGASSSIINACVQNFGTTSAFDVRFEFPQGRPRVAFNLRRQEDDKLWMTWEHGIGMLAPGQRLERLFDNAIERPGKDLPDQVKVNVLVQDWRGKPVAPNPCLLDVSGLKQGGYVSEYGVHEVAKALQSDGQLGKLVKSLDSVRPEVAGVTATLDWLGRSQRGRSRVAGQRRHLALRSPSEERQRRERTSRAQWEAMLASREGAASEDGSQTES